MFVALAPREQQAIPTDRLLQFVVLPMLLHGPVATIWPILPGDALEEAGAPESEVDLSIYLRGRAALGYYSLGAQTLPATSGQPICVDRNQVRH